jgi:germination protein M
VLNTSLNNKTLLLNLSEGYKNLNSVMEILTRASLVKSLTQIDGIERVSILIKGEPLQDSLGKKVGNMTADMFIDNAGEEISTYEKVKIRLYFTNEDGDALIAVDRSKPYNTNISLDKFVMEELLKGPESTTEGVHPTLDPGIKLISTYVKDRTCYVNFDSAFLTKSYDVDTEIIIYSIVNSLCSLSGIDKVQILVDGKTDVMFHGSVSLTNVFKRDLSYIQNNS